MAEVAAERFSGVTKSEPKFSQLSLWRFPMKSLIAALVAASFAVSASPAHKQRIYTFTQAQLDKMQDEIGETVRRREADAYEAGQEDIRERCPSLI